MTHIEKAEKLLIEAIAELKASTRDTQNVSEAIQAIQDYALPAVKAELTTEPVKLVSEAVRKYGVFAMVVK